MGAGLDDYAQRHAIKPFEGSAVAAQPGGAALVPDELDLHSIGRGNAQAHGDIGGQFAAQLPEHAHHGRVAARKSVFAPEGGRDGAALHARVEPALDHRTVGLDAGDGRTRHLAPLAQGGHDHGVVGRVRRRVKPAMLKGDCAQLAQLVADHQARACHLAHRVSRAQSHEHLSVLNHLECPASHWVALLSRSLEGRPWLQQASKRLR